MARYRLPEVLGGAELETIGTTDRAPISPSLVGLRCGDFYIWVPATTLTEVEPPLPPEPVFGSVVRDRLNRAWQHNKGGRGDWECTEDDGGGSWKELQEWAPLTLLVPDLLTEAPELPWTNGVLTVSRSADPTYVVDVSFGTATNGLHRETARDMGLALLRAAAP